MNDKSSNIILSTILASISDILISIIPTGTSHEAKRSLFKFQDREEEGRLSSISHGVRTYAPLHLAKIYNM